MLLGLSSLVRACDARVDDAGPNLVGPSQSAGRKEVTVEDLDVPREIDPTVDWVLEAAPAMLPVPRPEALLCGACITTGAIVCCADTPPSSRVYPEFK